MFTTSLYELNTIIKDRIKRAKTVLYEYPKKYIDFINVFLKVVLDTLAPYQYYDYKIELKGPNNLGYSLLYKINTKELLVAKEYITKNLYKGFIKYSYALYIAPILFVRKYNGKLRFYIDYQKLNNLT